MGPRHDPDRENCDRDLDFKKGSSIAINILTVDEVFFISFIGKLVHNHLQKCLFNATKSFFSNFSFFKLCKRLIAEEKLKRSRSRFCDRDH